MAGIVIIGAGECGVRAAFALREGGFDGPVTLIGDERHLPYERPPLSKHFPVMAKQIAAEEAFAVARIELRRDTRVTGIDTHARTVETEDGTSIGYEKLLIATGATARRFPGMDKALTLRTLDDAGEILSGLSPERHLAIIGGGFIGLELAAIARMLGARVTVIEAADRLMARAVPAVIAAIAEERHRHEGVEIILGAQVKEAASDSVRLSDGRMIHCDMVVAGVGAVANTALAEAVGLAVGNGIVVDGCLRTSAPEVYAAGDCCSFPYLASQVRLESWRAAQDQANHVAGAMLGKNDPYAKVPWFWSDQYDLTLQVAGLPEAGRASVRRDVGDDAFILFETGADGGLVAAAGIGRGNAVARDIRLAEMMIERGIAPDMARLADPSVNLKALLKG